MPPCENGKVFILNFLNNIRRVVLVETTSVVHHFRHASQDAYYRRYTEQRIAFRRYILVISTCRRIEGIAEV